MLINLSGTSSQEEIRYAYNESREKDTVSSRSISIKNSFGPDEEKDEN